MNTSPEPRPPHDDGAAPPPASIAPRWARALAHFMDDAIRIPGTRLRFGWDPVLGLIAPWIGDAATASSQVALIWSAFRAGVPRAVFARMLLNVAIDVVVGMVPLVGDLFDAGFKANRKNLALIERVERDVARKATFADYALIALVILALLLILLVPTLIAGWAIAELLRTR